MTATTDRPDTLPNTRSGDRPLADVRVLDFTRVLAGPLASALLADLGADVVKVEPPQGDDYRSIGPMRAGESALFSAMNRNKRGIVLDLKSPAAREVVRRLAAGADLVFENFRPGVADRLGIGAAALREVNPKLVFVSISGFGQTGPLAQRPAYDIVVQAMSGLMEATGDPAGPPTLVGEAVSDVGAGLWASWAALAALHDARATGRGRHVDVAMLDTTLAFLATATARYLFTGEPARRVGNRHPLSAPFGVYRARDGHFAVAVLNEKLFAAFAAVIGRPEFTADPRFASDDQRLRHEPVLRDAIETWAARHSADDAVQAMEAAGVPAAPIRNVAEAYASPHAEARALLRAVDHPRIEGLRVPVQPVKFGSADAAVPRRAPALGEHTAAVLAEWLGADAAAIAAWQAAGAFGDSRAAA